MLSAADGKEFVRVARKSVAYYLHTGALLKEASPDARYNEKRGVFVTLHSFPERELRGCIGYPEPVAPLWRAIIENAVNAAFSDPRFAPLQANELEKIIIEVSVLTKPVAMRCERNVLPKKIKIGKDGLIIRKGFNSGLLLPQVASELKWNSEQFLCALCGKAGLNESAWKDEKAEICTFQSQIFAEERPNGRIIKY
ncbi:MAG: TIGR00296 family protein [Candidatus Diapherotrites archaeon]|nr:TIGR00296 family protein [Candidatus Diapherotrites archaeon]